MRAMALLMTALAIPAAAAQDRGGDQVSTVVVTATSLRETAASLEACLARHCPPNEDIDASLAHAENQFLVGDYSAARRTLAKAHGRNDRFARSFPVEVADLNRAYGRLTNLDGHPEVGRILQIDSLDALKAGLDDKDSRVLMQRLMIGDEYARLGRLRAAEDVYGKVARQARKAGQIGVVGFAMLRDAVLYAAMSAVNASYRSTAEDKIRKIEKTRDPELAIFRDGAKVVRAQLAALRGDQAALDKTIAAIPPQAAQKPLLVYSPPILLDQAPLTGTARVLPRTDGDPEWVDIRFLIAADGTVHGIEPLRDSGNLSGEWAKVTQKSLARRRYAPLALPPGSEGAARVERFSYIYDSRGAIGTRLPGRSAHGRVTSLDLTLDPPQS